MFDGSSIAGWKAINESDMMLMPDPTSAVHRPVLRRRPRWSIFCDVLEPPTGQPYNRDPRSIAKKAEAYLKSTGIGDTVFFGPEAEFFIFDDVRFAADPYNTGFKLDSIELPTNTRHRLRERQHRPPPRAPRAAISRCRRSTARRTCAARCWRSMARDGRRGRKAPPRGRLGPARARPQVRHADDAWPTTCRSTNTSSTTSPTPTARRRPSCRSRSSATTARACTSTSRSGRAASRCSPATNTPTCRENCLYYIGGIIKHAKALNAFTNPLDQLLQAPGARLRSAGAARLFGAQPLGLVPHPVRRPTRRPSASRCASPIRRPTPTSPSPRC